MIRGEGKIIGFVNRPEGFSVKRKGSGPASMDLPPDALSVFQLPFKPELDREENTVTLELVLPGGELCGTIVDAETGRPPVDGLFWELVVFRSSSAVDYHSFANRVMGSCRASFRIPHVIEGYPVLLIRVHGYQDYWSSPLSLSADQALDLGKIVLHPTGIIDVEAWDERGRRLLASAISCQGKEIGRTNADNAELPDGRARYWQLPAGPVEIEVSAWDPETRIHYGTKKIEAVLKPGIPEPVRVFFP